MPIEHKTFEHGRYVGASADWRPPKLKGVCALCDTEDVRLIVCRKCGAWVCINDWDDGLCTLCRDKQ